MSRQQSGKRAKKPPQFDPTEPEVEECWKFLGARSDLRLEHLLKVGKHDGVQVLKACFSIP